MYVVWVYRWANLGEGRENRMNNPGCGDTFLVACSDEVIGEHARRLEDAILLFEDGISKEG